MTLPNINAKLLVNNHLIRIQFDFKKNTLQFNKETYHLNQLTYVDKIGYYSKDNSKYIFIFIYPILQFISLPFIFYIDFFLSLSIGSFIFALACAYTNKLFSIQSSIYRIILDDKPFDILINDLDAYNLNIKKQELIK